MNKNADDLRKNKEEASDCSVSSDEIVKLQRQVKELQMKVDVMTEVFELLKKEQGTDIEALKPTVISIFFDYFPHYPVLFIFYSKQVS